MAKNLYIYKLNKEGELSKTIWEDVKVTRDKRQIVTKRSADYKLQHGTYKDERNLEQILVMKFGFPNPELVATEYISFSLEEINDDIKKQLVEPFIEKYTKQQEELQNKIYELEELKNKFKEL